LRLYCGDCLDILPGVGLVDSVVTDPPYGLRFMGKKWDYDISSVDIWRAVFGVLKPGGFMLAFGGTRTYHRMVVNIEDAGFEIRDMVEWVYGCLSEDTELLIDGRWEPYHRAIDKGRALCYDSEHDEYQWQPIQDFVVYEYDDTAFRIFSDHTDQIVSRNHRCLVERGGAFKFELAEEVARERKASVPILEGLPDLLNDLPLPNERAGVEKQVLSQGVFPKAEESCGSVIRAQGARDSVPRVWQKSMEAGCLVEEGQDPVLFKGVQREDEGERVGEAREQGACRLDRQKPGILQNQDDRREKPGMEGRGDILPQARELQADKVCPLSGGVFTDGEERWICNGTPSFCCTSDRAASETNRNCSSQKPQSARQFNSEPNPVCEQSRSQTVRASRHTRTDLARIEPIHYVGKVWCIRVPSGAFVARRNGKVFVTGNSGFPKSLDVSKAIDKAAGVEGDTIGNYGRSFRPHANGGNDGWLRPSHELCGSITAPATEAARQWEGFGTALKPAHEPICLARKPLEGTVAQNVLKHGCGGLNIDGCRVGTDVLPELRAGQSKIGTFERTNMVTPERTGRFPANLIHDGSPEVVALFPVTGASKANARNNGEFKSVAKGKDLPHVTYGHNDNGGSAARFFYCAKASKADRGKGNNHPTVKPTSLMRYLCRLVTPPGGIVLDPFMGSGSTGKAALLEGFDFIGIEREVEFYEIAKARVGVGQMELFN